MAPRFSLLPSLFKVTKTCFQTPNPYFRLHNTTRPRSLFFEGSIAPANGSPFSFAQASRSYRGKTHHHPLFGKEKPGTKKFREAFGKAVDGDDCLYTGSEDDSDKENYKSNLDEQIKKIEKEAKEHADLIDADDSDELRSVWSGSDEEKTLWTGSECDDDDDTPTEPYPNEKSDSYIDKLFEFDEKPKYQSLAEALKSKDKSEELSPGQLARKIAYENALKKLKKGPDGRYTNVWEVCSDLDVLIYAFERVISGPEYEELRKDGPKKLNMEFFKDMQAKMRDPNYEWSPEIRLKPRTKVMSRRKWERAESIRKKDMKR